MNWNSKDHVERATIALRHLWLEDLLRYQSQGNNGLAVYHDSPEYFSVEQGLLDLLARAAA